MEKLIPHCKLHVIKALVALGKVRATSAALRGAADLGLDYAHMVAVVNALRSSDFYKSMTTHADHRVWQDVYRSTTAGGAAVYLKLTVIDGVLIVSFKER